MVSEWHTMTVCWQLHPIFLHKEMCDKSLNSFGGEGVCAGGCQRVVLLIFLIQIVGIVVLQDQCAWALGNIAGDSVECRKILHSQGCLPPLVKLLEVQICLVCVAFMLLLYIILYI